MSLDLTAFYLAVVLLILIPFMFIKQYGFKRGFIVSCCRCLWVAPILCAFFPKEETKSLPQSIVLKPIHVLIDDSESMNSYSDNLKPSTEILKIQNLVEEQCARMSCKPLFERLSSLDAKTKEGYTPLSSVLSNWLPKVAQEDWLIITDGGDFKPNVPWESKLPTNALSKNNSVKNSFAKNSFTKNKPSTTNPKNMILGFNNTSQLNYWIKSTNIPLFSFQDKPILGSATLKRNQTTSKETVQLQVLLEDQVIFSTNAVFQQNESESQVDITLSPLEQGQHLLAVKILPDAKESVTWDNTTNPPIEVLTDKVGVLHLLGNPSWDGRFLRRFLKTEPKYDLVSFYILRDPQDAQIADERELNLIPFPVEKLFTEELKNFQVILLQNFNLFLFLQPEYQKNLVNFVKNGGGLFFIGGSKSLRIQDLENSPLKEILPFTLKSPNPQRGLASNTNFQNFFQSSLIEEDKAGPWFDKDLSFNVQFANPDWKKRTLANVYDDWEKLTDPLSKMTTLKGLHHLENVTLNDDSHTPLLYAKTDKGEQVPLALASYPDKGRALWLFTDSIWKLALQSKGDISRTAYQSFMESAMVWLLRKNIQKPLSVSSLEIDKQNSNTLQWQAVLQGPVIKYLNLKEDSFAIKLCNIPLAKDSILQENLGNEKAILRGNLESTLTYGEKCKLEISGEHKAFGSVNTSFSVVITPLYKDSFLGGSFYSLESLAELTNATLVDYAKDGPASIKQWMLEHSQTQGIQPLIKTEKVFDHFWIFQTILGWLLLMFMPLEVFFRMTNPTRKAA